MTRAMHEVQSDAMRLININLTSAIEACAWATVHKLSEQLQEIAQRGLYHASQERQREITAFAIGNYAGERESR